MAITEVTICNAAIRRVGGTRINALSDQTKEGITCNDAYYDVRDSFLTEHPWNFATKRVSLAALAGAPIYGFDKKFALPSDCVRVLTTEYDDIEYFEYAVEGRELLCNKDSIMIEYISNGIDTANYAPAAREALEWKLAIEISYTLVQSNELLERLERKYSQAMGLARVFDSQEGSGRQLQKSGWTNERL